MGDLRMKHVQFQVGHGLHREFPFLHVDPVGGVASVLLNGETIAEIKWTAEEATQQDRPAGYVGRHRK
jgi:hypothetical protein